MISKIISAFIFLALLFSVFLLGYYTEDLMDSYSYFKDVDGFYTRNVSEERVEEIADDFSQYGDWICIDVRDMSYRRAVEVCKHEVGHEIFAEVCEDDIDKCFEVLES